MTNTMDPHQITISTYNQVAKAYQDKFMSLDLYNGTYDVFCELVGKEQANIFEIGCGPGIITSYLADKRPGFKILATDAAPEMVKLTKETVPTAEVQVMDAREIGSLGKKFDGIVCGFCIPYLDKTNCMKFIRDSALLLEPNGILYFSLIEGDESRSGWETGSSGNRIYVHYYQEDFFRELLRENGFEMEKMERITYKPEEVHLVFIARKRDQVH